MNLLLRNYLLHKQYDQAERFRSQAQHQEPTRSSQQLCRYLHYLGRIRAIQLDYTGARDALQQALRKSPAVAKGFRATTLKWLTLVRLLMGEVPDRAELTQVTCRDERWGGRGSRKRGPHAGFRGGNARTG